MQLEWKMNIAEMGGTDMGIVRDLIVVCCMAVFSKIDVSRSSSRASYMHIGV